MGDYSNVQRQYNDNLAGDRYLRCHDLAMDENSIPWILNHIDCFVRQSRGNESVRSLYVYPCSVDVQDDEVWEKLGQAIGNMKALERIEFCTTWDSTDTYCDGDRDEGIRVPNAPLDWEILGRILSQVRQKIVVKITDVSVWRAEDIRSLARAIHGHPTIVSFEDSENFPYESLDTLYSALATLLALESIKLESCQRHTRPEDESTMAHPESLTDLLRVPSLRSVVFDGFDFTPALCQATANALMEGTAITNLEFSNCSFSTGECAVMIATGLSRNTSVSCILVVSEFDRTIFVENETKPAHTTAWHHAGDSRSFNSFGPTSDAFALVGITQIVLSRVALAKIHSNLLNRHSFKGSFTSRDLLLQAKHQHIQIDNSPNPSSHPPTMELS